MSNKNKLSIITICYNVKDEIERTCQSIVNQTNQNFEWIVVDGGSTDGTLDILNKYKDRMNIFISEPDTGIYNAMNKGITRATGEFLNFMNGGDCFASTFVIDDFLKQDTNNVDVLYGNRNFIVSNGNSWMNTFPEELSKLYFYNHCINHQSSFIRRSLFDKYGLYNEQYKIISDWEKWIVFIINGCVFKHWNYVVANFYDGGVGSTLSPRHLSERKEIVQKYFTEYECKIARKMGTFCDIISLFNFLPLLQIKSKDDGRKLAFHLFNIIPLYKIKKEKNSIKHYLFGKVLWLKIENK